MTDWLGGGGQHNIIIIKIVKYKKNNRYTYYVDRWYFIHIIIFKKNEKNVQIV